MTAPLEEVAAVPAEPTVESVERRARDILAARPAYGEIISFYLGVFRTQLAWQGRVRAGAGRDGVGACLESGVPLASKLDPALDPASLHALWKEMKEVFGHGNKVLGKLVGSLDAAEARGDLEPGPWLASLRPQELGPVETAARRAGVDADALATLARSVTVTHWRAAARSWLSQDGVPSWKHMVCPVCGDRPALGELRKTRKGLAELGSGPERMLHCAFCGTEWPGASIACGGCGSSDSGDARYYFTPDDKTVRIDFCKRCKGYLKVVDGSAVGGPLYVPLELVGSAHVDRVAVGRGLRPLGETSKEVGQ